MALQNLYFLHYNNYYNRIVKRESSLDAYRQHQVGDPLLETNFNPNDGVNTMHYVNWELQIPETMPDYCVVQEIDTGAINSCWFVIEAVRTLQGQMQFTLRRDLIADFYDEVTSATSFIEKATLSPSDPFIFNREDFTVNQIKKGEHLLRDKSGRAWIVGYLANNIAETEDVTIRGTIVKTPSISVDVQQTFGIDPSQISTASTRNVKGPLLESEWIISAIERGTGEYGSAIGFYFNSYTGGYRRQSIYTETGFVVTADALTADIQKISNTIYAIGKNKYTSMAARLQEILSLNTLEYINGLYDYQGSTVMDSVTGKYFKVSIKYNPEYTATGDLTDSVLKNELFNIAVSAQEEMRQPGASDQFIVNGTAETVSGLSFKAIYNIFDVTLTEVSGENVEVEVEISASRNKLKDAPYSMFAMPYQNMVFTGAKKVEEGGFYASKKEVTSEIATSISRMYTGATGLYDLQLLPYCPIQGMIQPMIDNPLGLSAPYVDLNNGAEGKDYSVIKIVSEAGDTKNAGIILWATESNFTLDINHSIEVKDVKVENQCDVYRICSPNYSGVFEFSAAKNGGVRRFNVDCTYKPYSPYIHVNPDFGGLYGSDYNDTRGLVCTGDFSLPVINDNWNTYQIQNKNFSEIFARQISNMEVNNDVQREREIWGAVTGAIGAATSGGVTGALTKAGPAGAIAGAAIAGGASIIAGVRDVQLSDKLRSEALSYANDMYGYNLGNIQALPYSLAKTSAITANNKLFPFLEYYSCTDEEKQAFRDKLKYNGMTVMRIGQIGRYLQLEKSYIKARIIRMENLKDEFHLLNEIAAEMAKGVFI